MRILYRTKKYEPVIVYSVRKVVPEYTGYLFRIRRSSDNAEMDIGFDANGNLDTTSLMTFVGAGSGYVKLWYDQSGNNYYQQQLTATSQPPIVESGALVTLNSKPSIRFAPPFRLQTAEAIALNIVINTEYKNTAFTVFNETAHSSGSIIAMQRTPSGTDKRYFVTATHSFSFPDFHLNYDAGNVTTRRINKIKPDSWLSSQWAMTTISNGLTSKILLNGSLFHSGSVSGIIDLSDASNLCIGNYTSGAAGIHTGLIQEVIIYDDYLHPAKRISIENNIKSYYGI